MAVLPRILPDFLDTWMEYTEFLPAPPSFRRWGGIFLISAALGRRTWSITDPTYPPLFPVLFVLLVGPPGCGKDMVINLVRTLLEMALEGLPQGSGWSIAHESVSAKGLLDVMASDDSEFTFSYHQSSKKHVVKYHSVIACTPELGTLLPEYNTHLISIFNELYNCKPIFRERVRGHGNTDLVIPSPHLGLLFGTQPTTLSETFPEQAFRMGFFSRTNIIFSKKTYPVPLYDVTRPDRTPLLDKLISDLRSIGTAAGKFRATPAFQHKINEFHMCNPGALTHSRFEDYNARRSLHLHKLAMICAISEGNRLQVDAHHFDRALTFLTEAESTAPSVFTDLVTSSGFAHTVEQVLTDRSVGEVISHAELERRLRRTHRPYEVGQILRSMIQAGELEPLECRNGMPSYKIHNTKVLDS